jgi:hypothetical protein
VLAAILGSATSLTPSFAATCIGTCGTSGANGVVGLSGSGNNTYNYISTAGGTSGAGQISGIGGTNGSQFTSDTFTASANDPLTFMFDYVTSDGAGWADYAWAELETAAGAPVAWLFTARTEPSGNTSPGVGLPNNGSTLTPASSAIQSGTTFSPLGSYSGQCYAAGCGNTGWITSTYDIATAGAYKVVYGVTNWGDTQYDSALAFDALAINGREVPVTGVPEPATWAMMLIGFGLIGSAMRKRRQTMRVTYA